MKTSRWSTGRRRAVLVAVAAGVGFAALGAPAMAPAQEPNGSDLKAEYDEVLGREVELIRVLEDAQAAREDAAGRLRDLEIQTREKQLELLVAHEALKEAEQQVERRTAARDAATERVEAARERLRQQIVASYVTGGDTGGVLEAMLKAQSGEEVGQALAFGRAVAGGTETLVDELREAQAALARAAKEARVARASARDARDEIEAAATFLVAARRDQQEIVQELGVQVLAEAQALQAVQGRKALVEGRINSMNRTSDSVHLMLASIQADQPDWAPGMMKITNPIPGEQIGSKYGMRVHPILGITRLHAGGDMGAPTGTEIHAPADGTVVLAEDRGGYGNTVVIDHGSSLGTLYGHNSRLLVSVGDEVERGDVIALVGSTGLSTGPHLHFETRVKGLPVDPELVIDFDVPVTYVDRDGDGVFDDEEDDD